MPSDAPYPLPDWGPLALSTASHELSGYLDPIIRLHHHLERVVFSSTEPMLVQIRLAWWREQLNLSRGDSRDPLLRALQNEWAACSPVLQDIIEGWELLLDEQPWPRTTIEKVLTAYGNCFSTIAVALGQEGSSEAAAVHGKAWAAATLQLAGHEPENPWRAKLPFIPRELRSLSVIGGLSQRASLAGGRPLIGDRMSPLVAMRLNLLGK